MTDTITRVDNSVQILAGARDKHQEALKMIQEARHWAENAENEQDLDYRRRQASEMERSYYAAMVQMMMVPQDHDGPLMITGDASPASFFWRHEKSGYHGGLIFHRNHKVQDATVGTWSVHT